jgi:hypothetical protein
MPSSLECRSLETRCLLLLVVSVFVVCYRSLDLGKLTSRYQDAAITHDPAHELRSIAPPVRNRRNVIIQVTLALVLNVEGEDVVREIFPFGSAFDQRIGVLEDMGDAVFKIRNA